MIYLDVTSAAASPVNMGVQRTVRGVWSHLRARHAVTPLRWDFSRRHYATLSPREEGFLNAPFAAYGEAAGTPGRWDWRHWREAWRDHVSRGKRGLPMSTLLAPGHTLLIPDLCWDARIRSWAEMAGRPGRKLAVLHDAMPLRIPGQADSNDRLFARYVRALAHLDEVICVSEEVRADLLRYWHDFGVAPKPIRVLPWPVPFASPRPAHPPNQAAQKIIYVARLKLRKNHLPLLAACEELWQRGETFSLDLIGIEDAFSDTRRILHEVRRLARAGRPVTWRKHISDAALAEAYRDCSFTVFPSRLEGFGLPIIESLWHGRPVICGRNGAIGEVARGGGCLQLDDQNRPAELAAAIALLLHDRDVYARLYDQARARTFRSWDDYGAELDAVLAAAP
jgi:glycosyltransferase involved in cell wall biosynthesis